MATERLRELGGLAVADTVRDFANRHAARSEELCGAVHAHRREVLTEGRLTDLGVGALQLASRGRHAARDVVEREVGAVLGLDDGYRVAKQARAMADRGGTLDRKFHAR